MIYAGEFIYEEIRSVITVANRETLILTGWILDRVDCNTVIHRKLVPNIAIVLVRLLLYEKNESRDLYRRAAEQGDASA